MSDFMVFLKRFVSHPGRVGSVIPSSRFLCRQMTRQIPWSKANVMIELGPGTGVFTQAILTRKREDTQFFVVERDPEFREILRERFPGLIICDEATQLTSYLTQMNLPKADVIISGLPFAVFPPTLRNSILENVTESLVPGGMFVTFQYSLQMKAELQQRFDQVDISFTPLNVPPAFVYTCFKGK
ncbi:phospholipid methyltransferase [Brevibacillus humidisoli]|uniref:class I SAM-dependent methyltransferase n=1 Tax=Brevibacillus humidisoli TaxID=2895522 RepID=UPI001E62529D|nr:rRNA adenine N-6-methyltransferase family protein [Brevibacillus humidisoli]UFJ41257.1 phospholipid methyltransferase [Brevibacillus humidisoli]